MDLPMDTGVLQERVDILEDIIKCIDTVLQAKDPAQWMSSDPMIVQAHECLKKAVKVGRDIAVNEGVKHAADSLKDDDFAPDFNHTDKLGRLDYIILMFGPDRDNILTRIYRSACMLYGIIMFEKDVEPAKMVYDMHALDVSDDKNELIVECRDILTSAWKSQGKTADEIAKLVDSYIDMCWSYAEDQLKQLRAKHSAMIAMARVALSLANKVSVGEQTVGGSLAVEMFGALLGEQLTDEQQGLLDGASEQLDQAKAEARIQQAAEAANFDLPDDINKCVIPAADNQTLIDGVRKENLQVAEIESLFENGHVTTGD